MTNLHGPEPYEQAVPEWTVGELRQALADLPDALPVRVAVPQVPTTLRPDEEAGRPLCGDRHQRCGPALGTVVLRPNQTCAPWRPE